MGLGGRAPSHREADTWSCPTLPSPAGGWVISDSADAIGQQLLLSALANAPSSSEETLAATNPADKCLGALPAFDIRIEKLAAGIRLDAVVNPGRST